MHTDPIFRNRWFPVFSNHHSKKLEQPPGVVKQVLSNCFGPVDQLVATPLANVNVIDDIVGGNKFFDTINNSRHAGMWHGVLALGGIFAVSIGLIVSTYRTLRNNEKKSHFFYFRRLLQSEQSIEVKRVMGENGINYEILNAAAYFYAPDISEVVRRKRRFFCWGKRRKEYAYLKGYLTKKGLELKKTNKEMLDGIFIEIIDKLVKYLNEKTAAPDLADKFQRKEGTCVIGFSEEYSKVFFSGDLVPPPPAKSKKNVSLTQSILEAIEDASFFYWICMFVFYFFPTVGVVAGLSFPPLAIAFGFLTVRCFYITYAFKKDSINKQIRSLNNKEADDLEIAILKRRYERDDVELKKQEVFINDRTAHTVMLKPFQDSKLHKDLRNVLNQRRFMKATAWLNGFVNGCFFPFFGIWLFSDLLKVIAGLAIGGTVIGPTAPAVCGIIFMVVAGVTLLLGVGYGIKKAIKAGKEQDEKYTNLEKEVKKLELKTDNNQTKVLDLSLHDYDRLFRRYSLEQPTWTQVKKGLNRSWVVISRLGTGSLVFRLVIWGSLTSFITVPAALIAPITVPFIISFAVLFAVWHVCAYNVERKWKQADNIANHFYSSRMVGVKEMTCKVALPNKKEGLPTKSIVMPKLLSTSKSVECLYNPNIDNIDRMGPRANTSGDISPDSAKSKISFNSSKEEMLEREVSRPSSHPLSSSYLLRRAELGGSLQRLDSPGGKDHLNFSSGLSSKGMACLRP